MSPYNDFSKVPPQTLENAQRRGSLTHDFCELHALGLLIEPIPDEIKGYFESFENWFDTYVDTVINTEERLYHEEYLLTGQYDMLCTLKGAPNDLVLIDYKTCYLYSKTWQVQTRAYTMMLERTRSLHDIRRIALKLDKDGNFPKLSEFTDDDLDEKLFLYHLHLHRFYNS